MMDRETTKLADTRGNTPHRAAEEPRTLDSETLFNGDRELRIMHGDACYRLTITRLNKLILTK
ncbi:MAG: hemin uptake protein HemP [Breoghania sp.]|nr:hemin uptake protein HemP [Breoghania sp.]MDJ0932738.1 hemin uptake protein HemP [Breoghania sp.]